ncbi:MAG: pentapeptide repeat-containing protein [Deltaproteobacteria bacterium]|nr:pentapeptide repeat-containing protein [Deltaproteobacteria bacterium]
MRCARGVVVSAHRGCAEPLAGAPDRGARAPPGRRSGADAAPLSSRSIPAGSAAPAGADPSQEYRFTRATDRGGGLQLPLDHAPARGGRGPRSRERAPWLRTPGGGGCRAGADDAQHLQRAEARRDHRDRARVAARADRAGAGGARSRPLGSSPARARAGAPGRRRGPPRRFAGAALTGAALTGAALTGAALTGAALTGAALAGAALTGERSRPATAADRFDPGCEPEPLLARSLAPARLRCRRSVRRDPHRADGPPRVPPVEEPALRFGAARRRADRCGVRGDGGQVALVAESAGADRPDPPRRRPGELR